MLIDKTSTISLLTLNLKYAYKYAYNIHINIHIFMCVKLSRFNL